MHRQAVAPARHHLAPGGRFELGPGHDLPRTFSEIPQQPKFHAREQHLHTVEPDPRQRARPPATCPDQAAPWSRPLDAPTGSSRRDQAERALPARTVAGPPRMRRRRAHRRQAGDADRQDRQRPAISASTCRKARRNSAASSGPRCSPMTTRSGDDLPTMTNVAASWQQKSTSIGRLDHDCRNSRNSPSSPASSTSNRRSVPARTGALSAVAARSGYPRLQVAVGLSSPRQLDQVAPRSFSRSPLAPAAVLVRLTSPHPRMRQQSNPAE